MADFCIEVGATDGFRYLGIQPPLDTEQADLLETVEVSNVIRTGGGLVEPHQGEAYTQLGIDTSAVDGNSAILNLARGVAEALQTGGYKVQVDETIQTIGFGRYLFDGQADRLR